MVISSRTDGYNIRFVELTMKFWKVAAIVAVATLSLLLVGKKKVQEKGLQPDSGDINDIFEQELNAD